MTATAHQLGELYAGETGVAPDAKGAHGHRLEPGGGRSVGHQGAVLVHRACLCRFSRFGKVAGPERNRLLTVRNGMSGSVVLSVEKRQLNAA